MRLKRRDFLKGVLGAGAARMAGVGGSTSLFLSTAGAAAPQFDDYKALVVFFLNGGNDGFNMIVPLGDDEGTGYTTYRASRGIMAINNVDLNPLGQRTDDGTNRYASASDAEAYLRGVYPFGDILGVNGVMPELAQLFADRQASAVANIGSLIEPVTKATLDETPLPPFLYAHNHQQRAMETGWADNLAAGGWAGRLADLWEVHEGGVNAGSPLGMNVSYGGATRLMTASYNSPVVLRPGRSVIFPTSGGFQESVFDTINSASFDDSPLRRVLKAANRRATSLSDVLSNIDDGYFAGLAETQGLTDPYGNPLFSVPTPVQLQLTGGVNGSAIRAAESAALMVKLGSELQLKRQVVFINMGGFDNHTALPINHPLLLREMSLAIWSFQKAMEHLSLDEQVTLCTLSDFGRTLGNNGDGTDHAWASHNLVVGSAVNGGNLFGSYPNMELGGDYDTSSKGRMIPTLAVDQYLATLASWFGVSDGEMPGLFPNLANFKPNASDPISSAYIAGLIGEDGGTGGTPLPVPGLPGI